MLLHHDGGCEREAETGDVICGIGEKHGEKDACAGAFELLFGRRFTARTGDIWRWGQVCGSRHVGGAVCMVDVETGWKGEFVGGDVTMRRLERGCEAGCLAQG